MSWMQVLLGAAAMAVLGWRVVVPLARLMPARLEAAWRLDAEMQLQKDPTMPDAFNLNRLEKSALIVLALMLGAGLVVGFGITHALAAYGFFALAMLLMVAINLKHLLIPDAISLPVMWVGLLYFAWTGVAASHVFGAAAGYLGLWSIAFLVKGMRGIHLIGHGDMKAMAMCGAWVGLEAIPSLYGGLLLSVVALAVLEGLASKGHRPRFLSTGAAYAGAVLFVAYGALDLPRAVQSIPLH